MSESIHSARRRILMLIPELGYGGAEQSFVRLYRLLAERHNVTIAVFRRHYAKGAYTQSDDQIDMPVRVLDDTAILSRPERWIKRWLAVRKLKQNCDVTISFLTGANMLNAVTGGSGHKIISMRGSRRYDPAFTNAKRFLYQYILDPLTFRLSDRIISISDGLTAELRSHVGWNTRNKIRTIELFFDVEALITSVSDPIEREIEELKALPVIMAAGRLSSEKGFQYLIPIFAEVRQRLSSAKLVLIGDGPLYHTLVNLCRSFNLPLCDGQAGIKDSAVIFLGYRKRPQRYFRVARLFVMSSLTEGFSNCIIEALAAGIPVLSTDCPWGPRSILWKSPPNVKKPYVTEVPTYADYGTLMPRIDDVRYLKSWVDTIYTMLMSYHSDEVSTELRRSRVWDFDYRQVGQKWLDLIDELAADTLR